MPQPHKALMAPASAPSAGTQEQCALDFFGCCCSSCKTTSKGTACVLVGRMLTACPGSNFRRPAARCACAPGSRSRGQYARTANHSMLHAHSRNCNTERACCACLSGASFFAFSKLRCCVVHCQQQGSGPPEAAVRAVNMVPCCQHSVSCSNWDRTHGMPPAGCMQAGPPDSTCPRKHTPSKQHTPRTGHALQNPDRSPCQTHQGRPDHTPVGWGGVCLPHGRHYCLNRNRQLSCGTHMQHEQVNNPAQQQRLHGTQATQDDTAQAEGGLVQPPSPAASLQRLQLQRQR